MKLKRYFILFIVLISYQSKLFCQDISLFEQFNGRYDFTFIGKSMNTEENNNTTNLVTTASSSTNLNLNSNNSIEKAYLYWAGSGDGDFEIKLNETTITSERQFFYSGSFNDLTLTFFSAFADITNLVQTTGNGTYTLSELDISTFEELHKTRRSNFAGWAILIIYKNDSLPINQINVYDGLEGLMVNFVGEIDTVTINLNNLNVLDDVGSKIGFLAWEGDNLLATDESLKINGDVLSNSQNPPTNAFNSTNSFSGENNLFNMDLDVYDIQNNIQVGDNEAIIEITTGRDFVMINTIVTKLSNQLPDGTITIDTINKECNSRVIVVDYTIYNLNCTNVLPSGTPIAIYINDEFFEYLETTLPIPIDGQFSEQITLVIPADFPNSFELKFVIDDLGTGTGIVNELIEDNNSFTTTFDFFVPIEFNPLQDLLGCNEGLTQGTFDFSTYEELVKTNPDHMVQFFESQEDATLQINEILTTTSYVANTTPKEIFVRINDDFCFTTTSFFLKTRNCPPTVYNYISANNDTVNDSFFIDGLRDVFLDFKIEIYNRWGKLVWTGNQNTEEWNGYIQDGFSTKIAPDGTYFYLIFLNDIDYPEPLKGYLYINQ
ncbi:gliding motility-associated C-terminal domain-containing protein [Flavobacterium dankookense]|uniref:Gliding motility-associated-like protein n=2 Tax=Flavobacterium TaxID=237 RepID=A0A4R6QDS3_9FLAO|nr:gliding motility-associated C-terminal domain-containing protein [Flavobacterium dankookense]TDP60994.1 gliding motility-associated-like protein [Flavobacterium dankookense]